MSKREKKSRRKKNEIDLSEKLQQKIPRRPFVRKLIRLGLCLFLFHQFVNYMLDKHEMHHLSYRSGFEKPGEYHHRALVSDTPHLKFGKVGEPPAILKYKGPSESVINATKTKSEVFDDDLISRLRGMGEENQEQDTRKNVTETGPSASQETDDFNNQQLALNEIFKDDDEEEKNKKELEESQIRKIDRSKSAEDMIEDLLNMHSSEPPKTQRITNETPKTLPAFLEPAAKSVNSGRSLDMIEKDDSLSAEEKINEMMSKDYELNDYYDDGTKKPEWKIDEEHGLKGKWYAKTNKKGITKHYLNVNWIGSRGNLAKLLKGSEGFDNSLGTHHMSDAKKERIHFGGDKEFHSALRSREDFESLDLDLTEDRFKDIVNVEEVSKEEMRAEKRAAKRAERLEAKSEFNQSKRAAKAEKARLRLAKQSSRWDAADAKRAENFEARHGFMLEGAAKPTTGEGLDAAQQVAKLQAGLTTVDKAGAPETPTFLVASSENYLAALEEFKAKKRAERRALKHGNRGIYQVDTSEDTFASGLTRDSDEESHENPVPEESEDEYLPNIDPACPIWDINYAKDVQPMINLNKNKFITPVLPYGPNNQLRGFRETVWLAIRLNRTLVIPPFFKHDRTDAAQTTGKGSIIPPEHRFSINALRQLIPVIAPTDMGIYCDNEDSFDIFFLGRKKYCSTNKMGLLL